MIKRIMEGEPLFTEEEAERAKEELVLEENLTRGFTFTGPSKSETVKLEERDIIKREKIDEIIEKTIKSMGFVMPNSTLLGEDGGSVLEALEELREKVNSLSRRGETLEAGEKLGILNRLKQMVKIKSRHVEVSKPSLPEDKINSILKDSKELKELKEKVESLSSRSETLEAGEKLGILNRLRQMVKIKSRRVEVSKPTLPEDIASILKDVEDLKKLKEKVESLTIGEEIIEEEIV